MDIMPTVYISKDEIIYQEHVSNKEQLPSSDKVMVEKSCVLLCSSWNGCGLQKFTWLSISMDGGDDHRIFLDKQML